MIAKQYLLILAEHAKTLLFRHWLTICEEIILQTCAVLQ